MQQQDDIGAILLACCLDVQVLDEGFQQHIRVSNRCGSIRGRRYQDFWMWVRQAVRLFEAIAHRHNLADVQLCFDLSAVCFVDLILAPISYWMTSQIFCVVFHGL